MKGTNSWKKVKSRWPKYKQKLFNFLISHRNAIKITLRINLTQVRMIIIRKAKTKKNSGLESIYSSTMNANCSIHYGNQYGASSKT